MVSRDIVPLSAIGVCSKCKGMYTRLNQCWCNGCFSAYSRVWRKSHRLTDAQRKKDNCRSYANVYKRRGVLVQEPCRICGSSKTQMHHTDYDQPLLVDWLCRSCHLDIHAAENSKAAA